MCVGVGIIIIFISILNIRIRVIIRFLSFQVLNFFGAGQVLKYSNLLATKMLKFSKTKIIRILN